MKEYSWKLIVIAKKGAKQRMHEATVKVKQICDNLKRRVKDEHFAIIDRTTKKSKEKEFTNKKNHLINKLETLKNNAGKKSKEKTTYIKQAVINLTDTELTEEQKSLLNLGPNFVPATKRIPFMDINYATETCAIDLENSSKETDAECLRQKVSHILNRNLNIKLRDNLSKPQRQALVQMKNSKDTTIYQFDKGSGFAVLSEKNAMQKIEEQLGKAKVAENDPTLKFTNKIQKILCRLRKEKKFTDREYFQIYPSDPIPPRLYGTVKAHKPEKNYPMRTIVSTIGTPAYGISKYLVEIIQPTLNKNNNKIQNSTSFVHEAKDWKIEPTEIQVSYDVVNIYPSVPLDRSIQAVVEFLQNDHAELKKRTKLNLTDIQQLLELCLSECYILYNNVIWTLENSGPIGLSIMVVLSECYLQRIEHISITQALTLNLAPKTFKRFVDDSHARFNNREQSLQFLDILNSQDPSIQYTIEFENENKQLSFLDVTITNTGNNSYDFKSFGKHQ